MSGGMPDYGLVGLSPSNADVTRWNHEAHAILIKPGLLHGVCEQEQVNPYPRSAGAYNDQSNEG